MVFKRNKEKNNICNKQIDELKEKITKDEEEILELTDSNVKLKIERYRLEKLIKVSSKINMTLDKKKVLDTFLDSLSDLLEAEAASIFLIDEATGDLVLEQSSDIDTSKEENKIRVPIGKGLSGHVAKTGEVINIKNAREDDRFFQDADKKTGFNTRSILCAPIKYQTKIIGVSQVLNKMGDDYFSEKDLSLFLDVINIASAAIVNSNLHEQTLEDQKNITRRNDQLLNIAYNVYEMSDIIKNSSKNVTEACQISEKSSEVALKGHSQVDNTVREMNKIASLVKQTSKVITKLISNTNKIRSFLEIIDDIATKTNVLSINAAIEASRAGKTGKGFLVISDSVRKLAQNTTKATKDIAEIIAEINDNSENIKTSMDNELNEIQVGIDLVNKSGEALADIVKVIDEMVLKIKVIEELNDKQNSASENMLKSVEEANVFNL